MILELFANTESISLTQFFFALIFFVGGYAAGPALGKRSIGAIQQLTGTGNDKARGVFDRGKNFLNDRGKNEKQYKAEETGRRLAEARATGQKGRLRDRARAGAFDPTLRGRQRSRKYAQFVNAGQKAETEAIQSELDSAGFNNLTSPEQDDQLLNMALDQNGSLARQQYAIEQLAAKGSVGQLRQVHAAAGASPGSTLERAWNQASGSKYGDIKDKAPDLVGKDLSTVQASAMVGWDDSTWENWRSLYSNRTQLEGTSDVKKRVANIKAEAAAAGTTITDAAAMDQAVQGARSQMMTQIHSIASNNQLSGQLSESAARMASGQAVTEKMPNGTTRIVTGAETDVSTAWGDGRTASPSGGYTPTVTAV